MHNTTATITTGSTGQVDKSTRELRNYEEAVNEQLKGLGKGRNAIQVNMETTGSSEGHGGGGSGLVRSVLTHKANTVFKLPVSDKWTILGTSQVQLKTNHTTRIVLGLLAVFLVTSVVLNGRVQTLAAKNEALETQLQMLEKRMNSVMEKVGRLSPDGEKTEWNDDWNEEMESDRVKRSLEELLPSITIPVNVDDLKKSRQSNESHAFGRYLRNGDFEEDQQLRVGVSARKRGTHKGLKRHARKYPKLEKLKERNEARVAKLKMRLQVAKERASYKILQLKAQLSSQRYEPRAAYLIVRDPSMTIEHANQHIGPWHIPESGKDIGFNDLWYQNLELDENGTSVVFQESGLYLIYAQVYYVASSLDKMDETHLGFRIYLKKSTNSVSSSQRPIPIADNDSTLHRPIPIAECVPSSSSFQTCFTQICWYIEKGDSVHLEHFTKAKPVIFSEELGQTFLGIVRLS